MHSANSWETADLGDKQRNEKFLRLMGASKVRIPFFCFSLKQSSLYNFNIQADFLVLYTGSCIRERKN